MATSYSTNAKLATPAANDRGWNVPLSATIAALDALAPIGGLAVTLHDVPSTSLVVSVSPGNFVSSSGQSVSYAGVGSLTLSASVTTYLWLTDAGTLTTGSAWPTTTPYAPLAVVVTGSTTVSGITDARVTAKSVLFPVVPTSTKTTTYTALPTDGLIRADATAGAFTITLPAASTVGGKTLRFLKIDSSSNAVTLSCTSTINGSTTLAISTQWAGKTLIADATSNTWNAF